MSEVYGGQRLCECCGAVITADRRMCGACFADRFAKAYDRHAPVQVPEGWKLVPKCPTTDMLSPLRDAAPKWNARSLYASILDLAPSAPVAVAQPASPSVDAEKVMGLVEEYFDAGVREGKEGRNHDDEAGTAQRLHSQIRALLTPATCKTSLQVVGWIPVGERLPDMPSGYVLVHCEGGNITNDFFCRDREFHRHAGGHYSRKAQGKESGYFQCSHRYGYRVTHWQPLPPPPAIAKQGEGE